MRRLALRLNAPAQDTLAGDDTFELRRFRHHGGVRMEVFAELDHATEGKLLVHHGGEPEFAWRWCSARMNVRHRMHHRGQTRFVIDGAASVELSITNHRIKRVNHHAFDRHRVHVCLKYDPTR